MKKIMFVSAKPLAMAAYIAAGLSVNASALSNTSELGSASLKETVCQRGAEMSISDASLAIVTSGIGNCQQRALVPSKGFVLADSGLDASTVPLSIRKMSQDGEFYAIYDQETRGAAVLLTPNHAIAVARSVTLASGNSPALSFDLAAMVKPAIGLQGAQMTGTYTILTRVHEFENVSGGINKSIYATPNPALAEYNYTAAMDVKFNGDGTCAVIKRDTHYAFMLTKDATQNEGDDYQSRAAVNQAQNEPLSESSTCKYTVASEGGLKVDYDITQGAQHLAWSSTYNVSEDRRYLVSQNAGNEVVDGTVPSKGDISVAVRTSAGDARTNVGAVGGNTYLFNALDSTYASSTPRTAVYERPAVPVYQEEECLTRGSLTFNGSNVDSSGTCSYQAASSCAARSSRGKEESAAGSANGSIKDAFVVADGATVPLACNWNNTPDAGLVVEIRTRNADNAPVMHQYTGAVSDNGQAIVLQGAYSAKASTPDKEAPPAFPLQKYNTGVFLLGQQFKGNLSGDAGKKTYNQFVWIKDETSSTARTDFNADGISDIYFRNASSGDSQIWRIRNGEQDSVVDLATAVTAGFDVAAIGNADVQGGKLILLRKADGKLKTLLIRNGALVSTSDIGDSGAKFKALGDVDGDGADDVVLRDDKTGLLSAVLLREGQKISVKDLGASPPAYSFKKMGRLGAGGGVIIVLRDDIAKKAKGRLLAISVKNAAKVLQSDLGIVLSAFGVVAMGDANGDGDDDIFMRDGKTGRMIIVSLQMGRRAGQTSLGYYSRDLQFKALGDADGDGDADVYLQDAKTGATQAVLLRKATKAAKKTLPLQSGYSLVGTGDFDGDGDDDMLYRDSAGANKIVLMQNGRSVGEKMLPSLDAAFKASLQL